MTDNEKKAFGVVRSVSGAISSFRMEGERSAKGMRLRFAGIIGIKELSDDSVEINNHSGRVRIQGKRLLVTVFENNQVEINGRVEGLEFKYGKN